MAMVALDAPMTKVVPIGSIEARWMVQEAEAADYMKHAKKHPKMQAEMKSQAERRLEDEKRAKEQAALEAAARQARLKQIGFV